MNIQAYKRIIAIGGWYDLIVTLPFALPWVATWNIANLSQLHLWLGFSGTVPIFDPLHLFFVNLMGTVVVIWSVLRIRDTRLIYGLYDGIGRCVFLIWMLTYFFLFHITPLVLFLALPEAIFGFLQLHGYIKLKD